MKGRSMALVQHEGMQLMNTHTNKETSQQIAAGPMMSAARVHQFGGVEAIIIEEIARPQPGNGEVLIRVGAAGVGPWDGWIRAGKSALPQPLPLTLGSDLAGIIEAVGPGVSEFAVGDAVFGVTNPRFIGAYADYAIASTGMIAKKPVWLGDVEAASLPVIAVTAWQALFDQAKLVRGQSVLVHGAAGNVGAYAVQFARRAGLEVIATASARDSERVKELGADRVIDRSQPFEEQVHDVDAVIDLVGGDTQARSFQVLRAGGTLISAVSQPDQEEAKRHGVEAAFFLVNVTTATLTEIAAMLDAGELVTNVGAVLPFADARLAHEMLEGTRPHPSGKIVLKIGA
jgi:NADPH:quinone reductase-like Zn-dependent oxidoreductase